MAERTILEERGYQKKILELLHEKLAERKNVIVELDCGLGKRVLTYLLVQREFSKFRFLVLLHSSSSLFETLQYLQQSYGGVTGLECLSSRTPSGLRLKIMQEARVVLATPQVTLNVLKKQKNAVNIFDVVLINEVDKFALRQAHTVSLTFPWNNLLPLLFQMNPWIVGMSGTLRDLHIAKKEDSYEVIPELKTIMNAIPNPSLILMDDLMDTDVEQYIEPLVIKAQGVKDKSTQVLMTELDTLIEATMKQIRNELLETEPDAVKGKSWGEIFPLLPYLPVSTDLNERYNTLTMVRKFVTAMTPWSYRRYLSEKLGITKEISKHLPKHSPKIKKIPEIMKKYNANKSVVLTSYVETAKAIVKHLEALRYKTYLVTGQVTNKQVPLEGFRKTGNRAVLVMSPIGERDIDLPEAELLIMHDLIRTPKTVYQRLKRIRGGNVVILFYENTSEEKKVEDVTKTITKRYPWPLR